MKVMKYFTLFGSRVRAKFRFAALATLGCALFLCDSRAAETNSPPANTALAKPVAAAAAKAPKKKLSGAELYSMHCNRCHPERYPNERTSAQWKTIVLHMRIRANIPAEDARAILGFLQDQSGY